MENFRESKEYLDIQKQYNENMELRKTFNPPHQMHRVRFAKYRRQNPEFDKLFKECQRLKMAKHRLNPENYTRHAEEQKSYNRKIKERLFEILGGKRCLGCGIKDERVLQFDHINGGGCADIRRFTGHMDRMRQYYVHNPEEARNNLQVYCANCNQIKKHESNQNTYQY